MNVDHMTVVPLDFFKWILTTSAIASLLVGLILLIKKVLGKQLNPRWHYIIWLILVIRLLLPWVPESPFSVFNLVSANENPTSKLMNFDIHSPITMVNTVAKDTVARVSSVLPHEQSNGISAALQILLFVWLFGILYLAIHTFVVNRRFANRLHKQSCICDSSILQMLEQCKEKMSIHRDIRLMESDQVSGPTLFGFLHPTLIIPNLSKKALNLDQLRYIFLHELAHYKRQDIAINWIMHGLLIIHWFNPVLWYAYYRMREDQEIACDALVLTNINPNETREYGHTIIELLENYAEQAQVPGMASFSGNKAQLKKRITMIKLFKPNSYRWSNLGVMVLIVLGLVILTNGKTSAQPSAPRSIVNNFHNLTFNWNWKYNETNYYVKVNKVFGDQTHGRYSIIVTSDQGIETTATLVFFIQDDGQPYIPDSLNPISDPRILLLKSLIEDTPETEALNIK